LHQFDSPNHDVVARRSAAARPDECIRHLPVRSLLFRATMDRTDGARHVVIVIVVQEE